MAGLRFSLFIILSFEGSEDLFLMGLELSRTIDACRSVPDHDDANSLTKLGVLY